MNEYAERVARGVLWLDHMHEGWRDKVSLSTFSLYGTWDCVHAADMGFNIFEDETDGAYDQYGTGEIGYDEYESLSMWPYVHLENEWRKVLAA